MLRSKFIGTVLVIILGVNLGAWTLSVATSSAPSVASVINVPVTPTAIDARSEAASVELSQSPIIIVATTSATDTGTTTISTSSRSQY